MIELLTGLMVIVVNCGPIAVWLALSNARDRRRDRAAWVVQRVCNAPHLRGRIAVNVRAPLLSRRTVVVLDMSDCSTAEVGSTMARLTDVLEGDAAPAVEIRLDTARRVRDHAGPAARACPSASHFFRRTSSSGADHG